ncbi:hypothetical protein D0863_05219 [Hortaea werneckii]|uniref:Elongator complex protein 6 n=1 Tax=Hortaea werneckii TaxID=91943 RepID=A0A3M7E586_HORWE|nr:hypothetical protein D0863_05219 [Hortaea werneckii]
MSSRNRIPPALEPYLRLPPETAQILLMGTLGCSIEWLTTRFIGALLAPDGPARDTVGGLEDGGDTREKETAVVLASWMRNEGFWRSELRRTCGLDLTKHKPLQTRYTFLDQLHRPSSPADLERSVQAAVAKLSQSPAAAAAADESSNKRVILVLDNPDVLLALGLASAQELSTTLLKLRSMVHATIVTCAADTPLLAAAAAAGAGGEGVPPTPLEAESAAFAVQQGHGADFVVSARELETGAAKDVSGVLRVTRGGAAFAREEEEGAEEVREVEALYLVQRDGNVKVFERGAASS